MDDYEVYMEKQRLALAATTAIESVMEKRGLNRSQLAGKLGMPEKDIEQILDGEIEITLELIAKFGLACDVRWDFVGTRSSDSSAVVWAPGHLPIKAASPVV